MNNPDTTVGELVERVVEAFDSVVPEWVPVAVRRRYAIAAIEATGISSLQKDIDTHRALISERSIERLAEDIAIACVDCRTEIKEARHRAMVRLGERLRNPLPRDLSAALSNTGGHNG